MLRKVGNNGNKVGNIAIILPHLLAIIMLNAHPGIKNKIDKPWDMFYSGGMSNLLSAIEQISYLIYMK